MNQPNLCLKAAVVERELTQRMLAQQLGLPKIELSRIVQGRKVPDEDLRQRIAHAVGRDVRELFAEDREPE